MLCVLWQKDRVALCQVELLSQGFSEMSKTCWLGTASPPFASPRTDSAYGNLLLICWPLNLCPLSDTFYP